MPKIDGAIAPLHHPNAVLEGFGDRLVELPLQFRQFHIGNKGVLGIEKVFSMSLSFQFQPVCLYRTFDIS